MRLTGIVFSKQLFTAMRRSNKMSTMAMAMAITLGWQNRVDPFIAQEGRQGFAKFSLLDGKRKTDCVICGRIEPDTH